jgi:hypothetical protein
VDEENILAQHPRGGTMDIRTILHRPRRAAAVRRDHASMRCIVPFALIVVLLVWTGAGLAGGQTTTTASQLGPHDCAQKKMSVLFFPSGHGASTLTVTEFVASTEQALANVAALMAALDAMPSTQVIHLDVVTSTSGEQFGIPSTTG